MIANNRIKVELKSELQMALIEFRETDHVEELTPLLDQLNDFDFEEFKVQLTSEIKKNIKEIWTNTKNGVVKSQKLDAILFEHFPPHSLDLKAIAYGIIDWNEKDIDGIEVDLGFDYDFADGLEQAAGLTLKYFNPYASDKTAIELDEYHLAECFKLKGLIAVHEVFAELDEKGTFNSINKNREFYFLVGEHDTSSCQLIYSIVE